MHARPLNLFNPLLVALCFLLASAPTLRAQEANTSTVHQQEHMPGMQHTQHRQTTQSPVLIEEIVQHQQSGTGIEPDIGHSHMLMWHKADWMLMFHGVAFLNFEQQS